MRMNSRMATHWPLASEVARRASLGGGLADLAASPLAEVCGAVVLQELISDGLGQPQAEDITGFEALTNKVHVSDYAGEGCSGEHLLAQGLLFAEHLATRLASQGRPFRVVLSQDLEDGEVTVRFFARRVGQPWGAEDVEQYSSEAVAQWDVPEVPDPEQVPDPE